MTRKGIVQPLVLAAILAAGEVVVWGLLSMWGISIGTHVLETDAQPPQEGLLFYEDGTALRYEDGPGRDRKFRDLEGNPIPASEAETISEASLPARIRQEERANITWEQRLRGFSDGREPAGYWYFVADGRANGSGYFVGYDSKSRARIGYLGTAGFRNEALPADELFPCNGIASGRHSQVLCSETFSERFPTSYPRPVSQQAGGSLSGWDVYVVGPAGQVYHADLHQRTVHLARDEQTLQSAAVGAGFADKAKGRPHYLLARTDAAVLRCDERGQELRRYPIPEPLRERDFRFGETRTGEAVMYDRGPADPLNSERAYRIFWVAADGRCREADVTLRQPTERPNPTLGVVVPAPVVLFGFVACTRPLNLLDEGLATRYPEALARALSESWPALLIAHLIAVVCAVLCYRRLLRHGATRVEQATWALFVLALGLPGWIAFRFGRNWPVLEPCPNCKREVPHDRECCLRCETEFPEPALTGTEVFA